MTQLIRQAEAWLKARWAKTRLDDESGAVTVDWVVLTAGIVGVAAVAATQIEGAVNVLGTSISDSVSTKPVD